MLYFLGHPIQIVRRPRRRTLTIKVHSGGVKVLTNQNVKQEQILDFLNSKSDWIQKNIQKLKTSEAQFPIPKIENGSTFPWLGERKYFQIVNSQYRASAKIKFCIEDGFLICYGGMNTSRDILKKKLIQFYKSEAEDFLNLRVHYWTERTGLSPKQVRYRAPKSRWGSCSSEKHVSLNWKLICQAPVLIDYVIVHELCHLKHLNHSDLFWDLVESILPQYQEVEKVLQDQVHLGNFLDSKT